MPQRAERRGFSLVEALLATALVAAAVVQMNEGLVVFNRAEDRLGHESKVVADLAHLSESLSSDLEQARVAAVTDAELTLTGPTGSRVSYRASARGLERQGPSPFRLEMIANAHFTREVVGGRPVLWLQVVPRPSTGALPRPVTLVRLLPGGEGR